MAKYKQERMTHQDTLKMQETLLRYLDFKIEKYPFMGKKDREIYPKLIADSFLSQGAMSGIIPRIRIGKKVCLLGSDIHNFALKMLSMNAFEENGDYYTYVDGMKIRAVELWKVLKSYSLILFPKALAEALSKSREKEKRDFSTTFYDWEAKKEKGNE